MNQYALSELRNCYHDNQDRPFDSCGDIDDTNHIYKEMHLMTQYALCDLWNCCHGNQNHKLVFSGDKDTAYQKSYP